MNGLDWKKEMPEVPREIHETILDTLEGLDRGTVIYEQKAKKIKKGLLIPLVAALCMAVGGTVLAGVNLYRQRMQEMNFEMLEAFYKEAYQASTFHFNRELSAEEAKRYDTLVQEYELMGRFPEGDLWYLESYEDYDGKGVALYGDRGTIFFPEGEMSDEELLQLIDFEHKVSYSIEAIGSEVVERNYEYDYDYTEYAPEAKEDEIIAYTGQVGVVCATEGTDCLYLAGENVIEKMTIGASVSEAFYEGGFGENAVVQAMEEDGRQGLYVLILLRGEESYSGSRILHISRDGELLYEKDIPEYVAQDIAVDDSGRLYVETFTDIHLYDEAGEELTVMEVTYDLQNGSLCRGKDGKVYSLCEKEAFRTGILCIDPDTTEQVQLVAMEGLPADAPHCNALAAGKDTDFVIWRQDGVYTYNLGEAFVHKVMAVYEAPLQWEGAEFMVLEDGRIVFLKTFDVLFEEDGNPAGMPVPESTRICYVTCVAPDNTNRVIFTYTNETELKILESIVHVYYEYYRERLDEIDRFAVRDGQGTEKVIWENGELSYREDMYLVKEHDDSGVIAVTDILSAAQWADGMSECSCDYWFVIDDTEYGYHSESGSFVLLGQNKSFVISESERVQIRNILQCYFPVAN